jgi:hypothetical protein
MSHPTAYVKAAQQSFAFKKIPAPPAVVMLEGACYLLLINHQFQSFISCHSSLNRQNHFLSFHYLIPARRVTRSQYKR